MRFADAADVGALPPRRRAAAGRRSLTRGIGAGELLPGRRARGGRGQRARCRCRSGSPGDGCRRASTSGSRVDVYVSDDAKARRPAVLLLGDVVVTARAPGRGLPRLPAATGSWCWACPRREDDGAHPASSPRSARRHPDRRRTRAERWPRDLRARGGLRRRLGVRGPRGCSASGPVWSCSSGASTSTTCWPRDRRAGPRGRGRPRRAGPRRGGGRAPASAPGAAGRGGRRGIAERDRAGCARTGSASRRWWPTASSTRSATRSPATRRRTWCAGAARADPARRRAGPSRAGPGRRRLGTAGRAGSDHGGRRPGGRAGRRAGRDRAGRRRSLRRRGRPAASGSWTRSRGCCPRPGSPRPGLWSSGSPAVPRALGAAAERGDRACLVPSGGSRCGPEPSSTWSRRSASTRTSSSTPGSAWRRTRPPTSAPGRRATRMTLGALAVADEIVVVGTADPVGLSRLARGLVELREVVGGAPVRVVVNRHRSSLGWSERDIAGMVEGFARISGLHLLPDDRASVDRALVAGRTLVECGRLRAPARAGGRGGRRRTRRRPLRRPPKRAAARTLGASWVSLRSRCVGRQSGHPGRHAPRERCRRRQ